MKKDAKLYALLQQTIARFITAEALQQVAHGMDTQVNESLNNTMTWFAPKNKVYCSTWSLTNRLSIGISINSIGFMAYYRRLFNQLGIAMTADIRHFLETKDRNRSARLAKAKTVEWKRKRIQRKMETLREETIIASRQRAKRDGTYKSGRNMAPGASAGFTEEELQETTRQRKKKASDAVCKFCNRKGHSRRTHRDCGQYTGPPKKKSKQQQLEPDGEGQNLDADEADAMDAMPFDAEPPSEADDDELEFFDAGTWSEDDADDDGSSSEAAIIVRATI